MAMNQGSGKKRAWDTMKSASRRPPLAEDFNANGKNGSKPYDGVLAPRNFNSPVSANSFYGAQNSISSSSPAPLAANKQHTSVKTYSKLKTLSPRRSLLDGLEGVDSYAASVLRESRNVVRDSSVFKPPASPARELVVPPEKIGFPNIGNTCYFNAVLQCLFALPSFVESVLEWCHQIDSAHTVSEDDKENFRDGKYRLLRATRMLAKTKMAGKQNEVRPALIALRDAFVSTQKDFAGFEQHDAQEFLGFYFESLQREAADFVSERDCGGGGCCVPDALEESDVSDAWVTIEEENLATTNHETRDEASATERSEGAGDETESAKAKNPNNVVETSLKEGPNAKPDPEELPTPVTSNFLFKTRLTRLCGKCDKSTETITKNLILPLHLPTSEEEEGKAESTEDKSPAFARTGGLQKLLRRALSTTLERTCDHCSEKLSASASEERMMNLPRHLLLLLPRVYYSRSKGDAAKVRSWVRIPPMLNLTNFVDDGGGDGDGDSELFKYVDLGMRDKLRAKEKEDKPTVKVLLPTGTGTSSSDTSGGTAETAIDLSADTSATSASCSSTEKPDVLGFNDSLSEDDALKRAMAISLEDSMSSEVGEGGAISRMTEEEQLRKAIEDSLKWAEDEAWPTKTEGPTKTPDVSPIKRCVVSPPSSFSVAPIIFPEEEDSLESHPRFKKQRMEKGQESDGKASSAAPAAIQINPDHEYRLTGVVSHLGDRANAGHYVADVCTRKGWRRYNDTLIRPTDPADKSNCSALNGYLFFYTHDAYLPKGNAAAGTQMGFNPEESESAHP